MVIKTADDIAKEYLNLVRKIAYQLKIENRHLDITDLLSAGNEGLAKAAIKAATEDRTETKLRNYCFTAIRNAMLTIVYGQESRPRTVSLEQAENIPNPEPNLTSEDIEILRQSIKELPEKYRRVIGLNHGLNGCPNQMTLVEVAEFLNKNYATIMTRSSRGIKLLKNNPRLAE